MYLQKQKHFSFVMSIQWRRNTNMQQVQFITIEGPGGLTLFDGLNSMVFRNHAIHTALEVF